MKTGFKKLDDVINIKRGDFILLGGTASVGKTNFALNIINNIAIKDKKSVLFFSLECSKESIVDKILSIAGMIPAPSIVSEGRDLKDSEFLKLNEIISEIDKSPIYIDDTPGISIEEICEKSTKMKSEKNISCVVIDYLELISFDKSKNLSRDLETNEILKNLKELAKNLNVPILLTSYNISYKKIAHRENHIPKLEDLNPNIDYKKYADIILLLHREECFDNFTPKNNIADIIIAKNKNDMKATIELAWNSKYLKFCNL